MGRKCTANCGFARPGQSADADEARRDRREERAREIEIAARLLARRFGLLQCSSLRPQELDLGPDRRPHGKEQRQGCKPDEIGSGNPGGRPKDMEPELKALARQHTKECIEKLIKWVRSDNPKASPFAAKELLNRGWGHAPQ